MASIPETDQAILYEPQNMDIFVNSVREGVRPSVRVKYPWLPRIALDYP
jgi:hypothetical protein